MIRRRSAVAVVSVLTLAVAGVAAADAVDALPETLPGFLTLDEPWEEPTPFPTVSLSPAPAAPAVLTGLDDGAPVPDAARLAELTAPLLADPRLGAGAGVVVLDVLTGEVLLDVDGSAPRTPASTIKLLTTTAALASLGEESRLRTTALLAPAADQADAGTGTPAAPTLYLRGGGDVLLAAGAGDPSAVVGHAGLGDLAAQTAAELAARGVSGVRVALDDTAYSGPTTAPGWGPIDLGGGFVAPVAPLAVDRGIVEGQIARDGDPALTAARTFAAALAAAGVVVEGDVAREAAPAGATDVAAVESATVGELVAHTLRVSDNDVAEALARAVAIEAGEPADFEHATAAVLAVLAGLGLDVSGVTMVDGSGLSEGNAVPPLVLARLVERVADPAEPGLVVVATGMPVAALRGSLDDRFAAPSDPAAGVLRAKTGTLLTVVGLAGSVLDADGRFLSFAVVADEVAVGGVSAARDAVDEWASRLAACGCS